MSRQKQALALRDLAIAIVKARGGLAAPDDDCRTYTDTLFKIAYRAETASGPHTIEIIKRGFNETRVLSVVWRDGANPGTAVVVSHRGGSWEQSLRRLAGRPTNDAKPVRVPN